MNLKRASHSVYDTCYHFVWCPKFRRDIFKNSEVRGRAKKLIYEIADEYNFEIFECEVAVEHVHIMLSFAPKYSIGEVVRILKSIMARSIFREYPELKKRLWSGELWEDSYFARTVGSKMTSEVIENYIKHHKEERQGPTQLKFKL